MDDAINNLGNFSTVPTVLRRLLFGDTLEPHERVGLEATTAAVDLESLVVSARRAEQDLASDPCPAFVRYPVIKAHAAGFDDQGVLEDISAIGEDVRLE